MRTSDATAHDASYWNPLAQTMKVGDLEGADAVVNLAGENIASSRWTQKKKEAILDSRVLSTRLITETIGRLREKPKVLFNASAIGIYGNRGSETLTEESSPGQGFLADVCKAWESETKKAEGLGVRVILGRFGVVLDKSGGALKKMLLPYKLGLAGVIGSGEQFMSWISLDDLIDAILFSLENPSIQGPVNFVANEPVTNRKFTKTLGAVLKRPTILPLPAPIARFGLGEMADEMLLSSQKVLPKKLKEAGFHFKHSTLKNALEDTL